MRGRDRGDDGVHVGDVVGDGQLAILAGHPVRHDLLPFAVVEAVQALHRHEQPRRRAGQRLELVEQVLARAGRSRGNRPRRRAPGRRRRPNQVAAVGRDGDRVDRRVRHGSPSLHQPSREARPSPRRSLTVEFRLRFGPSYQLARRRGTIAPESRNAPVFFQQCRRAGLVAGLALALIPALVQAQATGSVSGRVVDPSGVVHSWRRRRADGRRDRRRAQRPAGRRRRLRLRRCWCRPLHARGSKLVGVQGRDPARCHRPGRRGHASRGGAGAWRRRPTARPSTATSRR